MDGPISRLTRSWKQSQGNRAKALKGNLQSCSLSSACFRQRMQIQDPLEGLSKTGSLNPQAILDPRYNSPWSKGARGPGRSTCSLSLTELEETKVVFSDRSWNISDFSTEHGLNLCSAGCHVQLRFSAWLRRASHQGHLQPKPPLSSHLDTAA